MSLEKVVANIAHAAVFVDPEQSTSEDIMDLNDFVDCMEAHCNEVSLLFDGSRTKSWCLIISQPCLEWWCLNICGLLQL